MGGIVAAMAVAVPPAAAQQTPTAVPARAPQSEPDAETEIDDRGLAEWLREAQNLEVREAMAQIGDSWSQIMLALAAGVLVFLIAAGVLRPGGFRAAGIRDVKPWPIPMWLFAGLLVFLAYPVASSAAGESEWLTGREGWTQLQRDAITMAAGCAAAVGVGLGVVYLMSRTAPAAGLKGTPMDLLVGIGGFLLAFPLIEVAGMGSAAIYQQATGEPPAPLAHETLQQIVTHRDNPWVWVLIGAVVVGVPIMEELIFRVGLQSAILRATGSPWTAVILASLGFTALHWGAVPADGWYAFGKLLVLSLALGIAYERSKRIGVPMTMHMAFNAVTIAIALSGDPAALEAGGGESAPAPNAGRDVPAAGG